MWKKSAKGSEEMERDVYTEMLVQMQARKTKNMDALINAAADAGMTVFEFEEATKQALEYIRNWAPVARVGKTEEDT